MLFSFRIVVYGQKMINAIVPNSAKAFNFQQEYGLTQDDVSTVFFLLLLFTFV